MSKITVLFMWLTLGPGGVLSAAQCPAGFVDLGRVSATAPAGRYQEVKETGELSFVHGIAVDESYRQKSIEAASDGAASDMRAAQIPAGFDLVPGGQSGGGWWSIDNPELIRVPATGDQPAHWVFRIHLYANTGGRGSALQRQSAPHTSPSVWVEVCVRPRNGPKDQDTKCSQATPNGRQ